MRPICTRCFSRVQLTIQLLLRGLYCAFPTTIVFLTPYLLQDRPFLLTCPHLPGESLHIFKSSTISQILPLHSRLLPPSSRLLSLPTLPHRALFHKAFLSLSKGSPQEQRPGLTSLCAQSLTFSSVLARGTK